MTLVNVIVLIMACAIAAAAGYYVARSREEPLRARLQRDRDELQGKLIAKDEVLQLLTSTQQQVQSGLGTASQQLAGASDRSAKQTSELTRLQEQLEELQRILADRERELAEAQASLRLVHGMEQAGEEDNPAESRDEHGEEELKEQSA